MCAHVGLLYVRLGEGRFVVFGYTHMCKGGMLTSACESICVCSSLTSRCKKKQANLYVSA